MRMTNTERVTLHRHRKRLGLRPVTVIVSEPPGVEKVTLVFEGVGAGKIRVNSSSFDHPLTILDDQANRNRGDREEGADDALGLLAEPKRRF